MKIIVRSLYFILFALVYISHIDPFHLAEAGVDASWSESLVMSIDKGLEMGTDFIFNYGPLGFLNTGLLPEKYPVIIITFYWFFVLANFIFIVNTFFNKFPKQQIIIAIIGLFLIFPSPIFADATFTLFWIFIFWMFFYLKQPNSLLAIYLAFLAALIIPIKLNISIFIMLFLIFTLILGKSIKNLTISILTFFILIRLEYYFLHFNFLASLQASIKIIDAYQDAMSIVWVNNFELFLYLGLTILSFLSFFVIYVINKKQYFQNLFLFVVLGIAWFLQYKQAFTALALININGFISFLVPLAILVMLFAKGIKNTSLWIFFGFIYFIQILGLGYFRAKNNEFNGVKIIKSYFPSLASSQQTFAKHVLYTPLRLNPSPYFEKLANYDYALNYKNAPQDIYLTKELKQEIGTKSIDIMPWEISILYFNQLNYSPRPVIQSYQANSDWLAMKNGEKYWGNNKPHWVLANVKEFRTQNPYWMDVFAYASLKQNYSLTDTVFTKSDTLFLFEKKQNISQLKLKEKGSGSGLMQKNLLIPNSQKVSYLKAEIKYDIWGKIAKTFFQPPYLWCEVTDNNNKKYEFRIPPSILKGGIPVKYLILDNHTFVEYQKDNTQNLAQIKAIKFYGKFEKGFKNEFNYSIFEIE